jgi:hypothetical protein
MFKTFQQFVRVCKYLDQLIPWNLLPILQEMFDIPVFIVINMDALEQVCLIRGDSDCSHIFQVFAHHFDVFRLGFGL